MTQPPFPHSPAMAAGPDVLVVGAGPVGLAVAVELGLRGIPCQVIDEIDAVGHWWTRAMNMNKRTMEHMRRWGLAGRLKAINHVPAGWPSHVTFVDGLGGTQFACVRAEGLGWHRVLDDAAEDALWVAQGQVQELLLDKARELGARIAFSSRATAVEVRDGGRVAVTIEETRTRQTRVLEARYLIGCDGGRSLVRGAAGIPYEGAGALSRQVSMFFHAPDLLAAMRDRGIADSVMYFSASPEVPGTARLICGDRWEFTYRPPPGTGEDIDAHAVIRRLIGPGLSFTLERTYPFSYFELLAQRFRDGPVFLAGDAAHLIPPLGGHNLNLGVGDAVNLGWKLAHVLRGWADEAILRSYDPERRPIVQRTSQEAHANYERLRSTFERLSAVMQAVDTGPGARNRREALSAPVARDLEPQWWSDGTVLDQRYTASPIVRTEPTPGPAYDSTRYPPHAAPGHRAPMWRLADGTPLYDRFGPEYTLLDMAPAPQAGQAAALLATGAGLPLHHLRMPDAELARVYGAPLALIRPDQHVAWRGESLPPALLDVLTGRVAAPLP
ncbi:MAG: hypothetical protein ABS43_11215 [Bordetella sp. SCN 67-23]|nr:FAD-dependent monooxygenase [Burkholderiales bacterium]ODS74135.1 MAG: hypothetical protein ABS43_11215 [Bordetella sp. SCN 67-23]OJW87419.1 MAG: hypothetical protein BGO71_28935 [Burkholderiales bacterium 67-32]